MQGGNDKAGGAGDLGEGRGQFANNLECVYVMVLVLVCLDQNNKD